MPFVSQKREETVDYGQDLEVEKVRGEGIINNGSCEG
jgi:hypothetical protein